MEGKLAVLKLYLDELGIQLDLSDVKTRKIIQKAVYIGQLSGVDLGYRYGWYKLGPYCSSLTDDYYELSRFLQSYPDELQGKNLSQKISEKLSSIKGLLTPPKEAVIKEDWLELVASYHFLRSVRSKNHNEALEILQNQKPHLVNNIDLAKNALAAHNLV